MIILSQNEMFFILLMDIGSGKREKENARTCAETRDACQKTSDEAEASQRRRGRSPDSLENTILNACREMNCTSIQELEVWATSRTIRF